MNTLTSLLISIMLIPTFIVFMFFQKRNCLIKFFVGLLVVTFLIFLLSQNRHFCKVANVTFTIFKTKNGAYIVPYKYFGFFAPKEDYIRISNIGSLVIFVDDATMLIFNDKGYSKDGNWIEICLTNYKYQHFPPIASLEWENNMLLGEKSMEQHFDEIDLLAKKRKTCADNLPFINIDMRWMKISIQNPPHTN